MEEEGVENLSPQETLSAKHKKEAKELQAQIQKLKHSVPKGDKKKKKDVAAQIAILEAELEQKHEKERQELNDTSAKGVDETAEQLENLSTSVTQNASQPKKPSKAQKRKEKKAQQEKEREERIREQDIENLSGVRHLEAQKMKSILGKRKLKIFEIPSDGNCLYCAVEDQLKRKGIESSMQQLRQKASNHMREHRDDFMPFLTKPESGDPFTEDDFDNYCKELESTAAWGGQLEVRALSNVLKHPIEIIQAEGPPMLIGDEYKDDALLLSYHRHVYGLGEHYNSVIPYTESDEEEELS
ncbi:OTU domain-containing protein 6B-like [Lingula anatina]|uniref:ubiquitinyl hydrolase 1 n=1 Tax=Lingula anatina TaxID=7574 RepID=A0A1S3IVB3_LINAN|nr:OTU domain-containing protein 6B-like [Lingula anatina]|eukprot:XP_013402008.1 OTU domain-containing protein 6B-like [Lingula anatina]